MVIAIRDSGTGIPRDVRERIFEPFFSTKAMGRGLGLATVLGIVDAHDGAIAIDSVMGEGTTFRVWMPVSKSKVDTSKPTKEQKMENPEKNSDSPSSPLCALLVDDDPFILKTTSILLKSMKVESLSAESMRSAMTTFQKNVDRIGIVFLDAHVGKLDTVHLFNTIRVQRKDIPIVIVSGQSEEAIQQMFGPRSYNAFLGKPYTKEELAQCIARLQQNERIA